jgi:predicted permease
VIDMAWLAKIRYAVRSLWRRDTAEQELSDEVQSHLEMQIAANVAAGMKPEEARYSALRAFGGVDLAKEQCRDARTLPFLESILQDLFFALRQLRKTPGFTAVAAISLALGIGGTAAIFSVINGVLLKPLAYPKSEELISVAHVAPGMKGVPLGELPCSPSMYFTYRENNRVFQDFGLWLAGSATITGLGDPERVQVVRVTYGTLQALGVQPTLGRWFSEADDTPATPETVILTYGYWQRHFGGEGSAIGRIIIVDSRPRTIIGVMPQTFRFEFAADVVELILPLRLDRSQANLGRFNYPGIARLRSGVTLVHANSDVARMLTIWMDSWPSPPGLRLDRQTFIDAGLAPRLLTLKQSVVGDVGGVLWVLMGAVGVVLLIACANVANLLLVRAENRHRELAIRTALGAGWSRIARSLLVESLLLAMLGGMLGLALAYGGLRMLAAIAPAGTRPLPRLNDIAIDPVVLGFTFAISVFTGILFGLAPVLKHRTPRFEMALRGSARNLGSNREHHRSRNALVVTQVALALMLLIGSGLLIRTFQTLRNVQPGFRDPASLQMFRIVIPEAQVKEAEEVLRVQKDILDRLVEIQGVQLAVFGSAAPMEGSNNWIDALLTEDETPLSGQLRSFRFAAPRYFETLGTPLVAGRDFTWVDIQDHRNVAILSENLARELWRRPEAALGKRVRENSNSPWRDVIGVVGDVYDRGVHQEAPKTVYWPVFDLNLWGINPSGRSAMFLIRSERAGTESFTGEIRQAVWSVNDSLPLLSLRTLDEVYRESMGWTSFTLVMLAIAALMALLLGLVGIYGVISFSVAQRTHEIGIRGALGATRSDILRLVMSQGLRLVIFGLALGTTLSLAVSQVLSSFLFGVTATDPLTFTAVVLLLAVIASVASYIPARRATRVDPMIALRSE